jgi:hypothetical protein
MTEYKPKNDSSTVKPPREPVDFYRKIVTQNKKTGVRITNNKNEYKEDPFHYDVFERPKESLEEFNMQNLKEYLEKLDLNIDNYSRVELFKLYGIKNSNLTEEIMKQCKKITQKTHPDKSRLHEKYFIFYSRAYQKLEEIYQFNKKLEQKQELFKKDAMENKDEEIPLKQFLEETKPTKEFQSRFNELFEKYRIENPNEVGYENWLKSDEDICFQVPKNINAMDVEMNKYKKQVHSVVKYNDVESMNSNYGNYAMMQRDNFTSGGLFGGNSALQYTDLKQAYVESVIPVHEDDEMHHRRMNQFKNIEQYKAYRDTDNIRPIDEKSALEKLYFQENKQNEESAALAFYYATQTEKARKNRDQFRGEWSRIDR